MIIIKNKEQIDGIRRACCLAVELLDYLQLFVKPGISTDKLDILSYGFIVRHQALPAPLGYKGFPRSICVSVNDVVCHGIPSTKEILQEGDIFNIDVTVKLNGYYGDASRMYSIGKVSEQANLLVERTKESLNRAIKSLVPGKYLNECVGKVITNYLKPFNYGIVRGFGGHGVGIEFHEEPDVLHYDTGQNKTKLKPGMIFTLEPMINASPSWQTKIDKKDGWTARTLDGALSAQFEHTVLITKTSYEILTKSE